jgi:cell division protein FtsB
MLEMSLAILTLSGAMIAIDWGYQWERLNKLQAENEELRAENEELRAENEELKSEVYNLEYDLKWKE